MTVTVECAEVTQPVAACFAVLCDDALKLDSDLDDNRGTHPDESWVSGRYRGAGTGPDRYVNDPVVLADLLVVAEMGNNSTNGRSFGD